MPFKIKNNFGGGVGVWFRQEVGGVQSTDSVLGIRIGTGPNVGQALTMATKALAQAVADLETSQRNSAVDDFKQRRPV